MNRKYSFLLVTLLMAVSYGASAVENTSPYMIASPFATDLGDGGGFKGYCFQVGESPSTQDGVAALMRPCAYENNLHHIMQPHQAFTIISLPGEPNKFLIHSLHSGKCLTVGGNDPLASGAPIVQQPCSPQTFWYLEKSTANPNAIFRAPSGKCITGGGTGPAPLLQYPCQSLSEWTITPAGLDIGMRALHSSKCLDVNGTTEAIANVRQWACQNTSNQRGHIQISTYNGSIYPGSIRLRMAHSGKCIRPTFVAEGEFYKQYTCANSWSEMFKLNFEGASILGPYFSLQPAGVFSSLCASVNQSGVISPMSDGVRVLLRQCQGQSHQFWTFRQFNP
jgi:hypothetical protein